MKNIYWTSALDAEKEINNSAFRTQAPAQPVVERRGLFIQELMEIRFFDDAIMSLKRFKASFVFRINEYQNIHFRLAGRPYAINMSISEELEKKVGINKDYHVTIQRSPGKVKLFLNGEMIEWLPLERHAFTKLIIDNMHPEIWLKSFKITSEEKGTLFNLRLGPPSIWLQFALTILLAITLFLLSRLIPKGAEDLQFVYGPVLAAPLWAATLWPLPGSAEQMAIWAMAGMLIVYIALLIYQKKFSKFVFPIFILGAIPVAIGAISGDKGIFWGLTFGATVLLLALMHIHRKQIRFYIPVMLIIIAIAFSTMEMAARNSAMDTRLRAKDTGTNFSPDPEFDYIPDDLFEGDFQRYIGDLNFRSGKAEFVPAYKNYRIMVAGGSNTWGHGIENPNDTFSALLEKCLNETATKQQYEVLNMGVNGFALFHIYRLFENYGLKYQPDMLILYINRNDAQAGNGPFTYRELWDMKNQGQWKQVEKYYDELELPKKKTKEHWLLAMQDRFQQYRLYNALVKIVVPVRRGAMQPLATALNIEKRINPPEDYRWALEKVIALCREKNIRLVLVDEFDVDSDPNIGGEVMDTNIEIRKIMTNVAEEFHQPYLPLHEFLHKMDAKESLVFPFDRTHLNRKGHKEVANRICQFLQNGLVR